MKKITMFPVLFLLIVFSVAGYSQVSSPISKKERKKDKIWLVPSSFGQIPNAFSRPCQQPYVSPEDLYHPPSIKVGPWAGIKPATINNKDVFLGYSPSNNWLLKDPIGEIDSENTGTWLSVIGLCMSVLVSPVELEY